MTATEDSFREIARYYDRIMEHVDYDRWFMVTTQMAALLPPGFRHVDAACGTGTLLMMLRRAGWRSIGFDLSPAMLRTARKDVHAAAADLRAVPLSGSVNYITCLFDSMNFLLSLEDFQRALAQFYEALAPGGILYFDVVTERMVTDHYENQAWVERNGRFSTAWDNRYDRHTRVIETGIRVNSGPSYTLCERIYPLSEIQMALKETGFHLLAACDAHSWKTPHRKTIRVDVVASKGESARLRKPFRAVRAAVRTRLA